MSVRQISSRIELSFWQIIISLLSQSSTIQYVVRWFYLIVAPKFGILIQHLNRHRILRWGVLGLVFGFVIGFFIALF